MKLFVQTWIQKLFALPAHHTGSDARQPAARGEVLGRLTAGGNRRPEMQDENASGMVLSKKNDRRGFPAEVPGASGLCRKWVLVPGCPRRGRGWGLSPCPQGEASLPVLDGDPQPGCAPG